LNSLPLRSIEYEQEIRAAHDHEGTRVGGLVKKLTMAGHDTAEEILVLSLE
jgi:hypothetical protein